MTRTIALMTDFGLQDVYVGVMKAVMCDIAPNATLMDLTHMIEPQNVRQAAFSLMNAYAYFPKGTIFLVVVDPGVGTARRPILVDAGDYAFIAPDNGVLSYVLALLDDYDVYALSNPEYRLENVSNTFHGRDIFSPAAAHLAQGVAPTNFGDQLDDIVRLPLPELSQSEGVISGEVMAIDNFGNVITSIGTMSWQGSDRLNVMPLFQPDAVRIPVLVHDAQVSINGEQIRGIAASYGEAMRGELLAVVGSVGYLEIAVNQGNAAQRLDVAVGDRVELQTGDINAAIRD